MLDRGIFRTLKNICNEVFLRKLSLTVTQTAFTSSELTKETIKQLVKDVQS